MSEQKTKRCLCEIIDPLTGRKRKCKRKRRNDKSLYCKQHKKINKKSYCLKLGQCCYCGGECNELSQACGRCMRSTNLNRLGMFSYF